MKLKISLHNYCRLCAIGNAQLLHCEEVLFDNESSKTTLRDLVQMYMPAILKDDEGILLPKKICIACVKAMLNWGDFIHRSLNSHNYFMKLLSREFEVPADNAEIVTFIRETKNYFSGSLVRYFSRLTPESRVHFEKKSTPLNKNEAMEDKSKKVLLMKDAVQKYTSSDEIKEADIYQPNNEFEKSAVDTPSLGKRHSVDSSTLPSIFKRKVCRARARKRRRISSPSEKRGRALLQQKYSCQNQSSLSYSTGHPEPFLVSLNSSLPEKLFCTPSVTLYQEIVSNSDPYVPGSIKESEDDCRMLDVDNLVDGSTAWVYRLKKSELAYVLNSYGKNAQGSCITLQKRLINHLKQRIDVNEHQPLDNEESNNEERENFSETEVEAIEVPPNPNTDVVAQDHCYSKEAPPGYFRLEDELFKPRSSGPINMQFFVGMSSNLTENLISKMSASELSCILEICNIEREGSGAIRNKLIKYLNYIKATPSARPEASKTTNEDAERTVTDASSAVSSGGNRYSSNFDTSENPSDQSNDTPFKGFQSTHEASGNHSDQSGDSPFKGFQSDSYQNHTLEPKLTVSYGNPLDPCSEIDHVASNIKTEVPDTPNFDYNIYQNSELNIKEEPLDEYLESPDSTRLDNFNSYCAPTDSQLLCLNREIHSELIKYFKTYGVGENVDKYKCCVALEKLHPAIISFYCSPFTGYSSSLCSSPTSSTTITCPSPNLSPCSSSFDAESPPKKQMDDKQLIKVKKFEDLC